MSSIDTIGIIGAGAIGSAFARALARQNINVVIANSRGPQSLAELVADLGPSVRAGTVEEAAAQPGQKGRGVAAARGGGLYSCTGVTGQTLAGLQKLF